MSEEKNKRLAKTKLPDGTFSERAWTLRRFYADPEKVRVGVHKQGEGWAVSVTSRLNGTSVGAWSSHSPAAAINEALVRAQDEGIEGIDLDLSWAYPHPHLTPDHERMARKMAEVFARSNFQKVSL